MPLLEKRLENDLSRIRNRIEDQAVNVTAAVKNAVHALQTGDSNLAYSTILNDYPINRSMREIDRLCHRFIAIHLPSGTHLRLLSAVIRVNIELERIGDYAVTIAREGVQLSAPPADDALARELDRMANETLLMLDQAIRAFNELNAELAHSTKMMSKAMEYNLDIVYQEIASASQTKNFKDTLALFAVFSQLKRVADQAKNLCEETVFAATGEQKEPKIFDILFVDDNNSFFSPLAEAIARKHYPNTGRYRSAGRTAAENLNPGLLDFSASREMDLDGMHPVALNDLTPHEIADQHVIVCLQGDVSTHLTEIPFHTSVLHWETGHMTIPGKHDSVDVAEVYRTLALQVKDLMDLLSGEET
ncbi:MAG: hypothetical protein OXG56_05475 [Gammaproteobacteria bacterium]|nr:hypothetical protein [Gammaproteobacteria bacterium]